MQRDDLVLEYLQFYVAHPMRKHYVVTLNMATRETLKAILNPYAGSASIEFLSLQRACIGWHDKNENVALGCTFSIPQKCEFIATQLAWRMRHPKAVTFIQLQDSQNGTYLLDRDRGTGMGSTA